MGIIVNSKRVGIISGWLNLSFALEFVDDNDKPLDGVFKLQSSKCLVGCTEKGRLCILGESSDLDFMEEDIVLTFTESASGNVSTVTVTPKGLLEGGEGDDKTSPIVGIGQVGYMII